MVKDIDMPHSTLHPSGLLATLRTGLGNGINA